MDTDVITSTDLQEVNALGSGRIMLRFSRVPSDPREVRNQVHDARAALEIVENVVCALRSGYRFDDDMGAEKVNCLAGSLATLSREMRLLERILSGFDQNPVVTCENNKQEART